MTNRQISYEAKQVFYGENDCTYPYDQLSSRAAVLLRGLPDRIAYCADLCCFRLPFTRKIADFLINAGTFYACRDIRIHSDWFKVTPLCSALPFIRRAHIRFRLFHWLYAQFASFPKAPDAVTLRANINQISKVLAKAPCLQTLKLIWTETAKHPLAAREGDPVLGMTSFWKSHIDKIVQPLTTIQPSCTITKSNIMVRYMQTTGVYGRPSGHAVGLENAFSSSIDEILATRASSAR